MRVVLAAVSTHLFSITGILLLRTSAIYSGSRRVIIPLSIVYVVRPHGNLMGTSETHCTTRRRRLLGSRLPGIISVQHPVSNFQAQVVNTHLTGGIQSDGQPPNSLFKGCYFVRSDGVATFTILVLLALELGNNSTVRAPARRLNLISAAVVLTARGGFSNRTPTPPPLAFGTQLQTLVRSGTPLVKVLYRDSELFSRVLLPRVR